MTLATGPAAQPEHPPQWWERRWSVAALMLLSMVPLIIPDVPPLLDLLGHMGRYRVQIDLAESEALQRFYTFEWALIANMGVDVLVQLLAPVIGLEPAVKLIILSIPPLTVGGFLWVAREVHARIPPTALFAVPFAYNFPFHFGFVNFSLSMALAFLAFALWLRLARLGKLRLRALVFVPISCIIWLCHAFGWGTLGVLAFSAELVRQHDRGQNFFGAAVSAGAQCISLALPMLLMMLWRSEASGTSVDWFHWRLKWHWLRMSLRDRWATFDQASLALTVLIILFATVSWRLRFSRNLAASTVFLALVYVLLPRIVFGSAYADMRLAPYIFATALIAIRFPQEGALHLSRTLAVAGLAFLLVRLGGNTASAIIYDRTYDRELAALEHVPPGARMLSFVGRACREPWAMTRLLHLPGLAIVRREAFSNDQWTAAGAQLLNVRYRDGWPFLRDPSQIVTHRRCPGEIWLSVDEALAHFPRDAFDYVWLIQVPPYDPAWLEGMRPIWRDGSSVLYRVERADNIATSDTPAGSGMRPTR